MDVSFNALARLVAFIDKIDGETYPETPSIMHSKITENVLELLLSKYSIDKDSRILDIGCGQGPALDIFRSKGYVNTVGITLNDEDVLVCRDKGHAVSKMDQSFLSFQDSSFDFIWARHVIEHSIFPYFTLSEFARILSAGGVLYLEVPAPETSSHHERNPNHYSVLTYSAWTSLLGRCGFSIREDARFQITTEMGEDEYWGFICIKGESNSQPHDGNIVRTIHVLR